jgi:hypothetical protein
MSLIARVGQDLSAYRLTYSHAAVCASGRAWSVVHKLNTWHGDVSALQVMMKG